VAAATTDAALQKLSQKSPELGGTKRRKLEESRGSSSRRSAKTARRRRTAAVVRNAHGCSSSETGQHLAGIQLQLFDIV
jgi:hypothetical protein